MADAAQGIAQSLNSTLLDLNGSLHAPLDPFEVWEQRQHEVQHYRDTHPEEAREARDALISVYLTLVRAAATPRYTMSQIICHWLCKLCGM